MIGRRGQPTNAVFGVTRDLFNIIRGQKPTYIVCAIDAEGPAERVAGPPAGLAAGTRVAGVATTSA